MNNDLLIQKIIALTDGELSNEETAEVIDFIAQNTELQDEMNYHLKMKNAYSKAIETPPVNLKSKILATSGLGVVFWKTKTFISSAVSSVIILAVSLTYFFNSESQQQTNAINFTQLSNSINLPLLTVDFKNEPIDNNKENYNYYISKKQNITQNIKTQNRKSNVINSTSETIKNEQFLADKNIDELSNITNFKNITQSQIYNSNIENIPNIFLVNSRYKSRLNSQKVISNQDLEDAAKIISKFHIQARKTFAENTIDLDFQNTNNLDINNSSFAVFYELTNNLHIGFEFSKEVFAQNFSSIEDNLTTNYQQYFNSNIYAISAKYYMPLQLFSNRLSFYSKGLIGGTNIGPVTRLELATELRLLQNIALYAGYEVSNLTYFFDGNIFNSTRNGLSTGLRYDF